MSDKPELPAFADYTIFVVLNHGDPSDYDSRIHVAFVTQDMPKALQIGRAEAIGHLLDDDAEDWEQANFVSIQAWEADTFLGRFCYNDTTDEWTYTARSR